MSGRPHLVCIDHLSKLLTTLRSDSLAASLTPVVVGNHPCEAQTHNDIEKCNTRYDPKHHIHGCTPVHERPHLYRARGNCSITQRPWDSRRVKTGRYFRFPHRRSRLRFGSNSGGSSFTAHARSKSARASSNVAAVPLLCSPGCGVCAIIPRSRHLSPQGRGRIASPDAIPVRGYPQVRTCEESLTRSLRGIYHRAGACHQACIRATRWRRPVGSGFDFSSGES
jgi:hypothetical protein